MNPPFDGEMAPNRRSDRIKSLGGLAPSYVEPTIEYSDDQSSYSEEENDSPEASEPGYVSKKRWAELAPILESNAELNFA